MKRALGLFQSYKNLNKINRNKFCIKIDFFYCTVKKLEGSCNIYSKIEKKKHKKNAKYGVGYIYF